MSTPAVSLAGCYNLMHHLRFETSAYSCRPLVSVGVPKRAFTLLLMFADSAKLFQARTTPRGPHPTFKAGGSSKLKIAIRAHLQIRGCFFQLVPRPGEKRQYCGGSVAPPIWSGCFFSRGFIPIGCHRRTTLYCTHLLGAVCRYSTPVSLRNTQVRTGGCNVLRSNPV